MNQDSNKGKGIQKSEDFVMRFHKLRPSSEKTSSLDKLDLFSDFPPLSSLFPSSQISDSKFKLKINYSKIPIFEFRKPQIHYQAS